MKYKLSDIKKVPSIELPCRKTMYHSLEEAQDTIRFIKENRSMKEISAYKCMTCGFWHLTSKSAK